MNPAVAHWQERLASRVGMGDAERAALLDRLEDWCHRHAVGDPQQLLTTWEDHPELTVRRRPAGTQAPDLAVESFLIHNGVNVFGDIVCVAGRPEDLVLQGQRFVAHLT